MQNSEHDGCGRRLDVIAIIEILFSTILGAALLLLLDLRDASVVVSRKQLLPAGDEVIQLIGIAAFYAVVLTAAALVGLSLHCLGERVSVRRRRAGAAIKYWSWSLPFLPLFWFVAMSLFTGGTMQAYSQWGFGEVVVVASLLLGVAESRRVASRFLRWRFGRFFLVVVFLSLSATLRWLDARLFPDSYLYLHQLLSVAVMGLVSAAFWTLIRFRSLDVLVEKRAILALFGAGAVILSVALWHLCSLRDASPAARKLLAQELPLSSRLFGLVPYALKERPELDLGRVLAAGLSKRASYLVEARIRACELLDGQSKPRDKMNVLVVSVDAVRADHMSFMGYERDTTPFLSSLAEKSALFSQARSPSTTSFFSIHSLLSGTYVASIAEKGGAMPTLLSAHLASHGYHSAAFFSEFIFSVRDTAWPEPDLSMGFKDVYHSEAHSDGVRRQITDYVDQLDGGPFFIFTHIMDPHAPYEKHKSHDFGDGDVERYDSELAFMDENIGLLWADLEERGLADKTILIVTSDHGEGFGEGRSFHHGGAPTDVQCRIPLILHVPGIVEEATVIDAPVANYSIPATVVDLLGLPEIEGNECPSLLPLILNTAAPDDYYAIIERPTYSHRPGVRRVRAIIDGDFKLMLDLTLDVASLYNLKMDPQELVDLSDSLPERVEKLRELELNWRRDLIVLQSGKSSTRFPIEYATIRKLVLEGDLSRIVEFAEFATRDDPAISADVVEILFDAELKVLKRNQESIFNLVAIPKGSGRTQVLTDALRSLRGEATLDNVLEEFAGADAATQLRLAQAAGLWSELRLEHAPLLRRLLADSKDPGVKQQLHIALAKLGDETIVEQFVAILEEAPTAELPELLDIALSYPDELIWDRVFEMKERRDADFRHSLASSVGKYPSKKRIDWILSTYRSSFPSYRIDGLKAAKENLEDPRLRAAVLEMLRHDEDLRFKSSAISLASKYGGEDALIALHDVFVSNQAVAASCLTPIRRNFDVEFRTEIAVSVKSTAELSPGQRIQVDLPQPRELPTDRIRVGFAFSRSDRKDLSELEVECFIGEYSRTATVSGRFPTMVFELSRAEYSGGICVLRLDPKGKSSLGLELITAGAVVDPLFLRGGSLPSASIPLVLDRFSEDWLTHNELDDGLVWMIKKKGQYSFVERDPKAGINIEFCVARESLDVRVSLNGVRLGQTTLGSGRNQLSLPLKEALQNDAPNVIEIEVTRISGERPRSVEDSIGQIGLAVGSIVLQ